MTAALELLDLEQNFGPVHAVDGVSLTVDTGRVVALVGESGSGKSTVGRCAVRLTRPTAGSVRVAGVDPTTRRGRALRHHRGAAAIVFQDPASSLDPKMIVGDVVSEPLRLLRVARSVQASVVNLVADLQRDLGVACLFITHDLSVVEHLADEVAVMYLGRIVEAATRDQVLRTPRHPYTQALLSAAPVADPVAQRERRRVLLTGELPSPVDVPLRAVGHSGPEGPQRVACHLVAEDGTGPDVRKPGAGADGGPKRAA